MEEAGRPPGRRSNRAIGIGLLVAVAALAASIGLSDWAHRPLRDGFLLGGFPLFAAAMMALGAVMLIVDGRAREVEPEIARFTAGAGVAAVAGVALLGLVFLAFRPLGFVPAIALFVAGGAIVLGYRPLWIAAAVGLGVALALRAILHALAVDIPDGAWLALLAGAGPGDGHG